MTSYDSEHSYPSSGGNNTFVQNIHFEFRSLETLISWSWQYSPRILNHSRRELVNLDVKFWRTSSSIVIGVDIRLSIHALKLMPSKENHVSEDFTALGEDACEEACVSLVSSTIGSVEDVHIAWEAVSFATSKFVISAKVAKDSLV